MSYDYELRTWSMGQSGLPLSVQIEGASVGVLLPGSSSYDWQASRTWISQVGAFFEMYTRTKTVAGTAELVVPGERWVATFNLTWDHEPSSPVGSQQGCLSEPDASSTFTVDVYQPAGGPLASSYTLTFHGQAGVATASYSGCDGCADLYQDGVFVQQLCNNWDL